MDFDLIALSIQAIDYVLFYLAGFAGMIAHQFKKWIRDSSIKAGFFSWLKAHPKYTASAVLSYSGAALGLVQTDMVEVGTFAAAYMAATTGYAADSAVNRSPSTSDYAGKHDAHTVAAVNIQAALSHDAEPIDYDPHVWAENSRTDRA